jgi:outer membrane protein assembly factor BamB
VAGSRAFVRSATGRITAHDLDGGALEWEHRLGPGVRAARPYSRDPGGARFPLFALGDRIWTAEFDAVVALDPETGAVVHREVVGTEVGTIVPIDDRAVAVPVAAGR